MGFLGRLFRPGQRHGIVLALGGGGARGLAHVGVLEVLEEAGIPVAGVAGSSAGAVVGAMWLALGSAAAVVERWRAFLDSPLLRDLPDVRLTDRTTSRDNLLLQFASRLRQRALVALAVDRTALLGRHDLDSAIAFLLPDTAIEALRLPLAVTATAFADGRPVVLTRGQLRDAVAASSAIPGVVPAYDLGTGALLDGGTVAPLPVDAARRLAPGAVVAVDVGASLAPEDAAGMTVPRAMERGSVMTMRALADEIAARADLVVRPAVGSVHWAEFARFEELRHAGAAATRDALPEIRRLGSR